MLGVYTIVKPAAEYGWGSDRTLRLGAGRAGAARRLHRPRSDGAQPARARCGSFVRATSRGANLIQALTVAGMFGMFFLGALYLQRRAGLQPA